MREKHKLGNFFSVDQYVISTPGHLTKGFRGETQDKRYHGGTINQYAASGIIWVQNQVSLGHDKTVMGNQHLEKWIYE